MGALALCWASNAAASAADAPAFCADKSYTEKPIDKDAFADEILISKQVPAVVVQRLQAWRTKNTDQTAFPVDFPAKQLLVLLGDTVCISIGCTKGERAKLVASSLEYARLLKDSDNLVFAGTTDPRRFFTESASTVRCRSEANAKFAVTTTKPGPFESPDGKTPTQYAITSFRVRGTAEDLIYPGGSSQYSDASKAKISFEDDSVSSKQSTKFVGALGYSILFPGQPNEAASVRFSWGVIPYAAFNIDTSKAKGKDKSVSSDTVELGTQIQFLIDTYDSGSGLAVGQYVALTPRYLSNRDDDSSLLGLGGLWRPTVSFSPTLAVNAFREIDGVPLKWEIIADGRFAYGHFARIGKRTGDDAKDFLRLGARYGLGVSTTLENLPLDLIVSDTRMFALSGVSRDLDLFNTSLALFFDADKHFGIDLSYTNGRANDLEQRADKWSIGLAIRY